MLKLSGIPLSQYEQLVVRLTEARRPLVLGAGTGQSDANGLDTNLAANLLNLMLDPELSLIDAANRHRVETAARRADVLEVFKALSAGKADLLILNNANPVFSLPPESGAKAALEAPNLFVVSLSNFLDETSQLADLILPVSLPLETWDDYSGWASARVHPPAGHGQDQRRPRTWATCSWRWALKTAGPRRISRPTPPSGCGSRAASATSWSGCARCSRAASSRRRDRLPAPLRKRYRSGCPRRSRRLTSRRRPAWPSPPRRPCASSTAAGRTGPGCARSRSLFHAWRGNPRCGSIRTPPGPTDSNRPTWCVSPPGPGASRRRPMSPRWCGRGCW